MSKIPTENLYQLVTGNLKQDRYATDTLVKGTREQNGLPGEEDRAPKREGGVIELTGAIEKNKKGKLQINGGKNQLDKMKGEEKDNRKRNLGASLTDVKNQGRQKKTTPVGDQRLRVQVQVGKERDQPAGKIYVSQRTKKGKFSRKWGENGARKSEGDQGTSQEETVVQRERSVPERNGVYRAKQIMGRIYGCETEDRLLAPGLHDLPNNGVMFLFNVGEGGVKGDIPDGVSLGRVVCLHNSSLCNE